MSKAATKYNPQCEPTLICEGFRFVATKYVDPAKLRPSDLGRYGVWGVLAGKAEQFGPLLSRLIRQAHCLVPAPGFLGQGIGDFRTQIRLGMANGCARGLIEVIQDDGIAIERIRAVDRCPRTIRQ